jgi:hypothetical protein
MRLSSSNAPWQTALFMKPRAQVVDNDPLVEQRVKFNIMERKMATSSKLAGLDL